MISRYLVVAEARSWVGTRWRHQARVKGLACDCFGLFLGVGLALGIPGAEEAAADPRLIGYGRDPDYETALAACRQYMIEVDRAEATLGDVLFMRAPQGLYPQHFGIISALDPPYMIHSWAQNRGVVENRIDEQWASRIAHAFRYYGVA